MGISSNKSYAPESHYYSERQDDIVHIFDVHAEGWYPHMCDAFGEKFTATVIKEARQLLLSMIPYFPYVGGDENPFTRHIIRSSTSLALYLVMKSKGRSAEDTGKIIYDAVVDAVQLLPPGTPPDAATLKQKKADADKSQLRRYPGDWVWDFVDGEGKNLEYGYDFTECGVMKFYIAHGAAEFLPFFCYLDFVTFRTPGWSFDRTMTLSEGFDKCDFRFKKGGVTKKGWPPPFVHERLA